jgi:NAD(P)H-dependent flavin oxidoreductase YrpB (nitropropane dioxygenase family)
MRTKLCDELGMTLPLFAFTRSPEVVVAVSRAGGMGVQAAIGFTTAELERCLAYIDARVEGRPYGVDVVMPSGFVQPDGTRGTGGGAMASAADYKKILPAEHVRFLDELLARHGVPPLPEGATAELAMASWTDEVSRKQVEVALGYPIRLIANALGPPPRDVIDRCHAKGVKVAALVGSKEHAQKQVAQGVDVIVAQGTEAGGHCGEISTMVLVPEVVDAVAPTPVVAAGGIGSGRQLAAALALGAQGGWAGSIWLTTVEGQTDDAVTRKLLAATSSDTVRSRAISGKPARQLKTPWSDAWEDPKSPAPLPMPLQFLLTAEAVARIHRTAREGGSDTLVTSPVGQIVGSMNRLRPVAEVLGDIQADFDATRRRMAALG